MCSDLSLLLLPQLLQRYLRGVRHGALLLSIKSLCQDCLQLTGRHLCVCPAVLPASEGVANMHLLDAAPYIKAWVTCGTTVVSMLLPHWRLRLCDDGSRPVLEQALPPYDANNLIGTHSLVKELHGSVVRAMQHSTWDNGFHALVCSICAS